jgi:asparagine synthetase B (glutamine-hydrolysing)
MYFDNFAVFDPRRQRALLTEEMRARLADVDPYQAYHEAYEASDAPTMLGRLLYVDAKTYLHELLMKQDQMSMAASIESRVPFLDHPLVEFVAGLPDRHKLRGMTTKWILREAMRDRLPAEILSRKKMGFPCPSVPGCAASGGSCWTNSCCPIASGGAHSSSLLRCDDSWTATSAGRTIPNVSGRSSPSSSGRASSWTRKTRHRSGWRSILLGRSQAPR